MSPLHARKLVATSAKGGADELRLLFSLSFSRVSNERKEAPLVPVAVATDGPTPLIPLAV